MATGLRFSTRPSCPRTSTTSRISEVEQALDAVREMKTRAFGQVLAFLYSGALLAQRDTHSDAAALRGVHRRNDAAILRRPADLRFSRPRVLSSTSGSAIARRRRRRRDYRAGRRANSASRSCTCGIARARRAAAILPNPARVMTHCNVSGELVAVAQCCRELGKEFSVVATETRPYLQGARLTAWELAQAGVAVSLIPDCRGGTGHGCGRSQRGDRRRRSCGAKRRYHQ